MRKKINYLRLEIYLFWESLLWTLIDLVRARRMRLTQRMHEAYKPPSTDFIEQSGQDIKK